MPRSETFIQKSRADLDIFIAHVRIGVRSGMSSVWNYVARSFLYVFLVSVFYAVWRQAERSGSPLPFPADVLCWYIAVTEWIYLALPAHARNMQEDIREGAVIYELLRPVPYHATAYAFAAGEFFVTLVVLTIPAVILPWALTGAFPFSFTVVGFMCVTGIAAGLVLVACDACIGLCAFFLHNIAPVRWIWQKLIFLLGGMIAPIAFYPEALQVFAKLTIFPAVLGEAAYGILGGNLLQIAINLALIVCWAIIVGYVYDRIYRRAIAKLQLTGG